MPDNYVLVFATDEEPLRIVGPFKTAAELSDWGSAWQDQNGDDPRWHSISLSGGPTSLKIDIEHPFYATLGRRN